MKIVVDTNILISTLVKSDGAIGQLLIQELDKYEVLSCYYLYIEIFDKKEKIKKYSKLLEVELLDLLYIVLKKVNFINENQISAESWEKAKQLIDGIDVKDISFVALAIQIDAYLWTGDKPIYYGLKKKGFDKVISTDDLRELLQSK